MSGFVKYIGSPIAKALKTSTGECIKCWNPSRFTGSIYEARQRYNPVTFPEPRQDADRLPLNLQRMERRRSSSWAKMNAMIGYVTNTHRCRMQVIQDLFLTR